MTTVTIVIFRGDKGFDDQDEGEENYVKFDEFYKGDQSEGEEDDDVEDDVFDAMREEKIEE